jgi:hypothetical protein
MSRWEEQLKNHQIHATLKEILELIGVEREGMTNDELTEKRRLVKVVTVCQDVLHSLDPEMVHYGSLDSLNNHLSGPHLRGLLTNYKAAPAVNYLNAINDQLTASFDFLSKLIAFSKKLSAEKPLRGLEKEVEIFGKSIQAKNSALQSDLNKTQQTINNQEARLSDLMNTLNIKRQETDGLIAQWQKQFSDAQDSRSADFLKDQGLRKSEYDAWRDSVKKDSDVKIKTIIDNSVSKLEKQYGEFIENISKYQTTATEKHQSILELYELVAGDSVGAGYLKNANDEKDQANFWRYTSVVFIVATALWTGFSYLHGTPMSLGQGSELLWAQVLKAFSVTAVLLFGAAYSAKQSTIHRQNEKRTRWFALEIKAIDPFISSLDDVERKRLKHLLAERLFGQKDSGQEVDGKVIDEHAFGVIAKSFADFYTAIKKA